MFYQIIFIIYLSNRKVSGQQCVSSSDPLVRCTTQGLIRGIRSDFHVNSSNKTTALESKSVYAFLGVPYGEPPIGDKRFGKPISKRPWSREFIYNTTTLPNSCQQMIIDSLNVPGEKIWAPFTPLSEDCLYLNIWTPITTRQQQQSFAVMVWIFGGGFTSGSSTLKVYDGSILSSTQNVIVISIEYRLDSLGFLYLGTSDAPGNQGLYDQQLALEWIYKNIKQFGGDPQRITLFGESAGGVSIGLHLLSYKSRSLFNNAILQSSGPTAKWAVLSPQIAKYRSEEFIDNITGMIMDVYKSGPTNPEYQYLPKECRKALITMQDKFLCVKYYPILNQNHFRLFWAQKSYNGGPIGYTFVPTIDNDFIPYDPEQMFIKGDFKKCPILLGVNKDEGAYFNIYVPFGNMTTESWAYVDYQAFKNAIEDYFRYIPIYPTKGAPMIFESILQTYSIWNDLNNTIQNAVELSFAVGDYHLTCPTIFLADICAQEGLPVYFYHFTLRASTSPWHQWMGVLHGDEVMFIFGEPLNITDNLHYTHEEVIVSEKMMSYWTNFAKYSNPNQRHDAQWANEWHHYKWPTREHIVLNNNLSRNLFPEHGSALRADYCSFWLDYIPKLTSATSNISEEETQWKQEFHEYQKRVQQWDYYYNKYLELLEKNREKFFNCLG